MSLLLVLGLIVAGCNTTPIPQDDVLQTENVPVPVPENYEEYVDSQIVPETSSVEIGELI
ncbi:MAG: hypothetical protein WC758_03415 [Candidatus Woesearchaeota archaeon]